MVPEVLVRGRMEDLQAQMEHMKAQFADLNPTIVYSEDDTGATVSFADQSSVRFRLIDETSSIPRQIQSCLLQMGIKAEDVGNVISLNEEGKNFTITLPNTAPDS